MNSDLTRIGRYEVLGRLGRGGMGKVYRAHDPDLDREVALKLLTLPDSDGNTERQQRFEREAQAAASLNHPHIVTVYDVDFKHSPPYVVMELLSGGTLQSRLRSGPLPWLEALRLLYPIVLALDYAHRTGVIHRDVKPGNIMFAGTENLISAQEASRVKPALTELEELDNIVKLVDFGLAFQESDTKLTQTGHLLGTAAYMSPEQITGQVVDGRTDIFALGIVLFEAITGVNPLEKNSIVATIAELTSDRPIDLSILHNKAPSVVINLIKRAIAKKRSQRYPTCEALLHDLANCLSGSGAISIASSAAAIAAEEPLQRPLIQTRADIQLSPELKTVLWAMFGNCDRIAVEAEFDRGMSGSRVLRVRPFEPEVKNPLPVVVKVAPIGLIQRERWAYNTWVKSTLPTIARLEETSSAPPGSLWDGLRYALVGGDVFEVRSLTDYYQQASAADLRQVLEEQLFKILGSKWWWVNETDPAFQMKADYDNVLPVNLLIKPLDLPPEAKVYHIDSDQQPPLSISAGDYVHLKDFIVTEIEESKHGNQVTLNLPQATKGHSLISYRLRLIDVPNLQHYQEGQVIDSLFGEIIVTRREQLTSQSRRTFKEMFDLTDRQITLPTDPSISHSDLLIESPASLPNPLLVYQKILEDFRTVNISTIHGDLNLENVLVDPGTGYVNLIDFAATREGHVLHDLLHLETSIITKLMPRALVEANLPPQVIWLIYNQLHQAMVQRTQDSTPAPPDPKLNKIYIMLLTIREMARECLFNPKDWTEYYHGLILYLLGALKFKDLDQMPEQPLPKQIAFLGAATLADLQAIQSPSRRKPTPPLSKETNMDQEFKVQPAPRQQTIGPIKPARLFICYKRHADPDQKLATYLHDFLTVQGHEVFIDRTMRTGEAWLEKIDQQLKSSDFLIVLLSKESADSEMVKAEVNRAYNYRQLQERPHTLPVRVAYQGLLPYSIAAFVDQFQYIVWQSEADDQRVAEEILDAIAGQLPVKDARLDSSVPRGDVLSEDGRPVPDNDRPAPPLPEFDPRLLRNLVPPGGSLKPRDKFYIRREADRQLEEQIVQWGTTTTIRAPRQTGKTSLLMRALHYAQQQGANIAFIDFQSFGREQLASLDLFLQELARSICDELDLDEDAVETAWRSTRSPQNKLRRFMENQVLPLFDEQVILAMDEADCLLHNTAFYKDFFGLLRSWHNRRARYAQWEKLNLVLVVSTEPYLLIDDINQSPFNVGFGLRLVDFNEDQLRELNHLHKSPVTDRDLPQLMALLNGHPFLTRRALYTIVTERMPWATLKAHAATDEGPFGDHLRHQHFIIRDKSELIKALQEILRTNRCSDEMALIRLQRAGLVKGEGDSYTCRCGLYEQYFQDKLF